LNLGRTHLAAGTLEKAEVFLQRALATGKELSHRYLQTDAAGHLGEVRVRQGNWDGAAEYYHSALRQARRIGHTEDRARFAAGLGRVWAEGRSLPKQALHYYEEALTALESLRAGLAEERHQLALMEQHQTLYAAAVQTAARAGAWETTLEWTERARSRAMADLLQASGGLPEPAGVVPPEAEAVQQLVALRERLRALYAQEERQEREGSPRGVREALRAERRAAEGTYEQAWQTLQRVRPEVAALWRTEALGWEAIPETLEAGDVALIFFTLPGEVLVFVITPEGLAHPGRATPQYRLVILPSGYNPS
jgi:tetratricopeptide (TPR) repeat protein